MRGLIFIHILIYLLIPSQATQPWSQRMLDSIISRRQGISTSGASTSTIANGILALALNSYADLYPHESSRYLRYREQVINSTSVGLINSTANALLPLDRFSIAYAIRKTSQLNSSSLPTIQLEALAGLDQSYDKQSRNPLGGLWYFESYPSFSYLDGMFSVLPYLASQANPNITDIHLQISLLASHCLDEQFGLLVHGYDYSRTAIWANRISGASPYVWGRSLGWYMTGLVQTYEILCQANSTDMETTQLCLYMSSLFTSLTYPLITFADNTTGAWFQLTTYPNRENNWLESSSTALFVFTLLKALRLGMISIDAYTINIVSEAAVKAYNFTTYSGMFVQQAGNGSLEYNGTVSVCSLNSSATYDYYTGRPIELNSLIGESAYVLAALEVERMISG